MIHLRIVAPPELTYATHRALLDHPSAVNVVRIRDVAERPGGDLFLCDVAREDASVVVAELRALGLERQARSRSSRSRHSCRRRPGARRRSPLAPGRRGRVGDGGVSDLRELRALAQLHRLHAARDDDRRDRDHPGLGHPHHRSDGRRAGVRAARRAQRRTRPTPAEARGTFAEGAGNRLSGRDRRGSSPPLALRAFGSAPDELAELAGPRPCSSRTRTSTRSSLRSSRVPPARSRSPRRSRARSSACSSRSRPFPPRPMSESRRPTATGRRCEAQRPSSWSISRASSSPSSRRSRSSVACTGADAARPRPSRSRASGRVGTASPSAPGARRSRRRARPRRRGSPSPPRARGAGPRRSDERTDHRHREERPVARADEDPVEREDGPRQRLHQGEERPEQRSLVEDGAVAGEDPRQDVREREHREREAGAGATESQIMRSPAS